MKKCGLLTFLFTVLISCLTYAQTAQGTYLNIDYMKVSSEDYQDFEKMVQDRWKPVYKEQLSENGLSGFYLYKVMYPGGEASEYNYTLISTFPDLNTLVAVKDRLDADAKSLYGNRGANNNSLFRHQYSELWKTEAGIEHQSEYEQSKFMVINYMRVEPGKEPEYLALENDIARPLHEERLKQGMMHSWRTFSIMKPSGLHYEYNFATSDYYDKLNNIEHVFTNSIVKSVMPGANFTETLNAMYKTRTIVKSELWKLVLFMKDKRYN